MDAKELLKQVRKIEIKTRGLSVSYTHLTLPTKRT